MKPQTILKIRTALGWTQRDMAERLGVKPLTVLRWENGQSKPYARNIRQLRQLARRAKVPA